MINVGGISYASAAVLYVVLAILLVTSWRGRLQGGLLVSAVLLTVIWAGAEALHAWTVYPPSSVLLILEVLRDVSWLLFLLRLMSPVGMRDLLAGDLRILSISVASVSVLLLLLLLYQFVMPLPDLFESDLRVFGFVLLAILGMVLVEHVFRNTAQERRWAIKLICIGLGAMFAYDFILYSEAMLYSGINESIWSARGAVNSLVVPLIMVSAARNPEWSLDVFISRRIAFHTTTLIGAGGYLLLMAAGGYYIRYFGGEWGSFAQAVFLFAAAVLFLILMVSGRVRSRIKLFINKHFFNYKYDYREEWLRFTKVLSDEAQDLGLRERVIQAIAGIVDSPGGILWIRQDNGGYEPVVQNALTEIRAGSLDSDHPLICFLSEHEWVIDIDEFRNKPEKYPGLEMPEWLRELQNAWLVVPLMQHDQLCGVILLARPNVVVTINWEDTDLLKTAGRQAASHLVQLEAMQALIKAQQFEAFNQLSAFVIHDLKNIVSQLSLLVSNAEKHKSNPEFIDDMVATVGNSVEKMNHLLGQLKGGHMAQQSSEKVELGPLLRKVVADKSMQQPIPVINELESGVEIMANKQRLTSVMGHIIQNAQDATSSQGRINVSLVRDASLAVVEVADTGSGMDEQFIRERLFKPFDTTKGSTGMGIGAYESREFIRGLGGDLLVISEPGVGSTFRVMLPLLDEVAIEA